MDDVTKEDLRLYLYRKQMIKILEQELEGVYVSSPGPKEVQGGKSSVPNPSDPTAMKARIHSEMEDRLLAKKAELEEMTQRIERFTAEIDDQIIGPIISWHYIRGLSWAQTCMKVYGYPDGDVCRKAVIRYFKKREANKR